MLNKQLWWGVRGQYEWMFRALKIRKDKHKADRVSSKRENIFVDASLFALFLFLS